MHAGRRKCHFFPECAVCFGVLFCALVFHSVDGLGANSSTHEVSAGAPKASADQVEARQEQLEHIILNKLAFYAGRFPDIDFVLLDTSGDPRKHIQLLTQILGEDPDPLDYEHTEKLHNDLLIVTLARIELWLHNDIGSATLLRPGAGALAKRKQVCVITLDPWQIAADNRAATRHLIEAPEAQFSKISPEKYLDADSHLRFALDHEIYHCLDSSLNGPIPMSLSPYWGDYQMFRHEAGADAFGVIMQLAEHQTSDRDAHVLEQIRALTLLNDDPNHFTCAAISAVLQLGPKKLAADDVRTRFEIASRIRDQVVGSYDNYLHYAIAAEFAMKDLGVKPVGEKFKSENVETITVDRLVEQVRSSYHDLVGQALQDEK